MKEMMEDHDQEKKQMIQFIEKMKEKETQLEKELKQVENSSQTRLCNLYFQLRSKEKEMQELQMKLEMDKKSLLSTIEQLNLSTSQLSKEVISWQEKYMKAELEHEENSTTISVIFNEFSVNKIHRNMKNGCKNYYKRKWK